MKYSLNGSTLVFQTDSGVWASCQCMFKNFFLVPNPVTKQLEQKVPVCGSFCPAFEIKNGLNEIENNEVHLHCCSRIIELEKVTNSNAN